MTARNEHTGDAIQTKIATENFVKEYDAIFNRDYAVVYLDEEGSTKELTVIASSVPNARRQAIDILKKVGYKSILQVK